jgi:hypothetical protein
MSLKIPKIIYEDITEAEFAKQCATKALPASDPKFTLKDIVFVQRDFGRVSPGMIVGIGTTGGAALYWQYRVVVPRFFDAQLEYVHRDEDKVYATEAAARGSKGSS